MSNNPVDIERLRAFSDGSLEGLRNLVTWYLEEAALQIRDLTAAIEERSAEKLQRAAHTCGGSSGACGMHGLAQLLNALEALGREGRFDDAPRLAAEAARELERIGQYLESNLDERGASA